MRECSICERGTQGCSGREEGRHGPGMAWSPLALQSRFSRKAICFTYLVFVLAPESRWQSRLHIHLPQGLHTCILELHMNLPPFYLRSTRRFFFPGVLSQDWVPGKWTVPSLLSHRWGRFGTFLLTSHSVTLLTGLLLQVVSADELI